LCVRLACIVVMLLSPSPLFFINASSWDNKSNRVAILPEVIGLLVASSTNDIIISTTTMNEATDAPTTVAVGSDR
jgi:hypothetical protein